MSLNLSHERRARMVMPEAEEFGVHPDINMTLLVGVVCLSSGSNAAVAQLFLCDKTGLPHEPTGETLLTMLLKNYIVQSTGGGFVLTTKGVHLAERVVKKVMVGL